MKMKRPGKMLKHVLRTAMKKPATANYPFEKSQKPKGYRAKIKFYAEKCIGCKMCMRDCPSNAITIKKVGDKQFEAEISMRKCIYCGQCVDSCMKKALEITDDFELAQLDKNKLLIVYPSNAKPQENTPK